MSEREFDSPVASVHRGQGIRVEKHIIVQQPAMELWRFWRNFENLPRIMKHLDTVTVRDSIHSHWVAKGPAGTVEWDAEIHNEMPGELIAWRSLGGDIRHAGSVRFREGSHGRGTEVIVELLYEPPGGKLGVALAKLVGDEPGQQIEDDLRRFKEVMELGAGTQAARPETD